MPSAQTPPLRQGALAQSSTFASQADPEKNSSSLSIVIIEADCRDCATCESGRALAAEAVDEILARRAVLAGVRTAVVDVEVAVRSAPASLASAKIAAGLRARQEETH
jgi:hypothetical protein